MYDQSLKRKWDNKNVLDSATKEGETRGELRGRTLGKQEGKQEATRLLALRMKENGIEASLIASISGLSAEEIARL